MANQILGLGLGTQEERGRNDTARGSQGENQEQKFSLSNDMKFFL